MKYQIRNELNHNGNSISIRDSITDQALALYYHNETKNIIEIYYHYSFYSDNFYNRRIHLVKEITNQDDIVALLFTCASMVFL